MKPSTLIGLYPAAWRGRYGDEMTALLEDRPPGLRGRIDLIRGALDAWLHPATPSRVPLALALIGGGLWTVVAAGAVFQPVPLDWPGYLADSLLVALLAVGSLFVATLGCARRFADRAGRVGTVVTAIAGIGYLAWVAGLGAALAGVADGPTVAVAQTSALVGTVLVGIILVRAGVERLGLLLLAGAGAMLVPWTVTWLAFGATWTAVGIVLALDRAETMRPRWQRS